jgi:hypothetical protein
MAYCSATEVAADFKSITFTSTDNISDTDVAGFITEADALINAYVGSVYTVPVASGDGLNLLKLLSRSLCAARIKKIMEVKQEKSADANQNVVSVLLPPDKVLSILKDIQAKKVALAGAVDLVSGGGFYSANVANSVEPVLEKDTKQW